MNQSFPRRLVLALALFAFVVGIAGCAATTTSTPQTRPSATATRSPVGPATTAPVAAATTGGLVIATPLPGDRMPTVKIDRLPPEALDTIRLIAAQRPLPLPAGRGRVREP